MPCLEVSEIGFSFRTSPEIVLEQDRVSVLLTVACELPLEKTGLEFFLHWGELGSSGENWVDEEIRLCDFKELEEGVFQAKKSIDITLAGNYAVSAYARNTGDPSCGLIWLSNFGLRDAELSREALSLNMSQDRSRIRLSAHIETTGDVMQALSSYDRFIKTVNRAVSIDRVRSLGRVLYDVSKTSADLRDMVSEYYARASSESLTASRSATKKRLLNAIKILDNIGVGEVMLVSPEGPHASAGGLAQVINGLMNSLERDGIPVTLVSCLYENAQGKKHKSKQDLLREGVSLNGSLVPINNVGTIKIPFGQIEYRSPARKMLIEAEVYLAENGRARAIFLSHERFSSALYDRGDALEQVMRAVFLSRGALEVVRQGDLDVRPHLIVSNDWGTGLIPGYLCCEPELRNAKGLQETETIHVLHNCGQDYQGRFAFGDSDDSLWKLIGLGDAHRSGFRDPDCHDHLNITAGAAFHVTRAILAVSKPYAQQLLKGEAGQGLGALFRAKQGQLFGISNGIDTEALRRVFWQIDLEVGKSEGANKGPGTKNEVAGTKISSTITHKSARHLAYNTQRVREHILRYKQSAKKLVQERLGLSADQGALLVSFLGRVAEQKGITLLSASDDAGETSVLESALKSDVRVQIIIAGPPVEGDSTSLDLIRTVGRLERLYPNRIRGLFDFVEHEKAMQLTAATDLFLMPSRYEPGGITQLEALALGTPVVARNVGGIAATLIDYDGSCEDSNAFLFDEYSKDALERTLLKALSVLNDDLSRERLVRQAVSAEHDWQNRLGKYLALFQHATGVLQGNSFKHLLARSEVLATIRA